MDEGYKLARDEVSALHPVRKSVFTANGGRVVSIKIIMGLSSTYRNEVCDRGRKVLYDPPKKGADRLLTQAQCFLVIMGCQATTVALGWYYCDGVEDGRLLFRRHSPYTPHSKCPFRAEVLSSELALDASALLQDVSMGVSKPPPQNEKKSHKCVPLVLTGDHRSGLEKNWQEFWDVNGVLAEYEPFSWVIQIGEDRQSYTPDFLLPTLNLVVEIKPARPTRSEFDRSSALAVALQHTPWTHVMICGDPVPALCQTEHSPDKFRKRYETVVFSKDGTVLDWNWFFVEEDGIVTFGKREDRWYTDKLKWPPLTSRKRDREDSVSSSSGADVVPCLTSSDEGVFVPDDVPSESLEITTDDDNAPVDSDVSSFDSANSEGAQQGPVKIAKTITLAPEAKIAFVNGSVTRKRVEITMRASKDSLGIERVGGGEAEIGDCIELNPGVWGAGAESDKFTRQCTGCVLRSKTIVEGTCCMLLQTTLAQQQSLENELIHTLRRSSANVETNATGNIVFMQLPSDMKGNCISLSALVAPFTTLKTLLKPGQTNRLIGYAKLFAKLTDMDGTSSSVSDRTMHTWARKDISPL